MIEYIFFDTDLRDRFVEYAASQGVSCTLQDDPMGMVVAVPEDTADDIEEALERCYGELEEEQSELVLEEEGGLSRLAGFRYNLPDGQSRRAPLQSDIANRLMAAFSLEEIRALFETVARSALEPKEEHLCKILAARKVKQD
ncbi:MAG TPA: hypothetical protein VFP33_03225 [Gallionella sp.]|nr:hypothetical protein [Gallionella sp.]